ncbi:hypothetical protein J3A83DRAFT_4427322, partial [Scleroderma citrinum]
NPYKVRAFERAIKVIGNFKAPIRSGTQVRRLGGVGERIAKRIDAFLANKGPDGVLKVANDTGVVCKTRIMESLQMISGIGYARTLYNAGCTSIVDLNKPEFFSLLSPTQKVCAQFATHLDPSVSLAQAEAEFVSDNISSKYEVFLVGDHRRNHSCSPTLSLVIVHPLDLKTIAPHAPYNLDRKPRPPKPSHFYSVNDSLLSFDIISPLEGRGLVAATLTAKPQRWRGIIRIPQRAENGSWEVRAERLRQIKEKEGRYCNLSISFVPKQYQGAALLALTGDLEFVKDICDRAHRLGLHFNEYGLWKWCEEERWEFMHGDNEEEIFRELGMEYIEPARRNFGFLTTTTGNKGRPRMKVIEMQRKPVDDTGGQWKNTQEGTETVDVKGIQDRRRQTLAREAEKVKASRGRPRKSLIETTKIKGSRGRPRKVPLQE